MKKIYLLISLIVVVTVGIVIFRLWKDWQSSPSPARVSYAPAKVSEVRSIVELQTVSIYEEVPFKAAVGTRHLVGRVTVEGTIGFDLDKVKLSERGDTLVVSLPAASVTLRESTAPDSYVVYDSWNDQLLGVSEFSTAQENRAKEKVIESITRNIYRRGEAQQARRSAQQAVARIMAAATGRPVKVE